MMRLEVLCEGPTEVLFVVHMLGPHLLGFGVQAFGRAVETKRDARRGRVHKGGLSDYQKPRRELAALLASKPSADVRFTTMFDLYGLPRAFPGVDDGKARDAIARAKAIEAAVAADLDDWRLIPYIQVHEYEALLLVDPAKFAAVYVDDGPAVAALVAEVAGLPPETINDGPRTAPSKRIIRHLARYRKPASLPIAHAIGLQAMRSACPHFADWLDRLERLAESR